MTMNKAGKAAVVAVGALFAVRIGTAVAFASTHADIDVPDVPEPVAVTYYVTGTADGVDITIETPTGTEQAAERAVPLRNDDGQGVTITGFTPGDFVYISAQNTGEDGTVICRIVDSDGDTISKNTSEGAYAIATCDGLAS